MESIHIGLYKYTNQANINQSKSAKIKENKQLSHYMSTLHLLKYTLQYIIKNTIGKDEHR